jgi:hypothetical protein
MPTNTTVRAKPNSAMTAKVLGHTANPVDHSVGALAGVQCE